MSLRGKKLGLLLSTEPTHANFRHGVNLAAAAVEAGVTVYLYCIDEAVRGVEDAELQNLRGRGLNLFACAYAAQRRQLPCTEFATFGGLGLVNDLIAGTDRFLSFN